MRSKVALVVAVVALGACSSEESGPPPPQTVIDLYDPCTTATTTAIADAVGFPMLRSPSGQEDADRFRSCRWVASSADTDPESIDYLDVAPRPFVDIVLRQTGVDDQIGVDVVFAEVRNTTNSRPEPALVATTASPRLADDVLRTEEGLWAITGERMLIILTNEARTLDALINSVAPALLERL
jgi:hypothetical protein